MSSRPVYLDGEKVGLAQLDQSDASWLTSYLNEPATTRFMATGREPVTEAEVAAQISAWKKPADYAFAVLRKWEGPSYNPIGYCGFFTVDWLSRKAEFRILIYQGYCDAGLGTEATRLIVRFGFEHLNLHRIWLGVTTENLRATGAYVKAGFVVEGTLEDDLYRNGRYYNSVRMAILRPRYDEVKQTWATEKGKQAATSESGPSTARSAAGPSTPS